MVVHRRANQFVFGALLGFALLLQAVYLANMIMWRAGPDKGWTASLEQGPHIVAITYPLGEEAGLKIGDRILAVNGHSYITLAELIALVDLEIGHANVYEIERDGQTFTVPIITRPLGLQRVLLQSGVLWALGIVFLGIGILVFLMKPYDPPSWAFFAMCMTLGTFLPYAAPSFFYVPSWLHIVAYLPFPLVAASLLHLTVMFPKRRASFVGRRWWLVLLYSFSLLLSVLGGFFVSQSHTVPGWLSNVNNFYVLAAVLAFLGSTTESYVRATSQAVRLQSLVVISGIAIAFLVPSLYSFALAFDLATFTFNPIYFHLIFLPLFPLSIGYAIVRHDLFEIDVLVRRTYGYLLSTASVVGVYALIVSILNATFQSVEFARSPLFSITFALSVVFFFGPLHQRIQRFVDRLFYRQQYDYREAINNITAAMTSILDPEVIRNTLVGAAVKEMSLDNCLLFQPDPGKPGYQVTAVEGLDVTHLGSRTLDVEDALFREMREKHTAIFRHDIDLHPQYAHARQALLTSFQALASELFIPMTYKNELRGLISLGRKKSGKMFTRQDLDLLTTMSSQSVIALENANLFKENLVKGRMEEELKIAHDMQMSMLPSRAPAMEGVTIAARSIPAREVGGDFYDFIEIGGNGTEKKLGLVIADVSGKGVSGALVMAASRSTYRVLAEAHPSVEEVMSVANRRLHGDIRKGMFVALLYAVLDPRDRTLTLSNAGQTQPILSSTDHTKPSYIETEGDRFPLGIVPDCQYLERRMQLKDGDTLVFYTDGIVEAMNGQGELYGFDRFMSAIDEGWGLDANSLLDKLMDDVSRYVGDGEQHDDLTIVVVKINSVPRKGMTAQAQ